MYRDQPAGHGNMNIQTTDCSNASAIRWGMKGATATTHEDTYRSSRKATTVRSRRQ